MFVSEQIVITLSLDYTPQSAHKVNASLLQIVIDCCCQLSHCNLSKLRWHVCDIVQRKTQRELLCSARM